MPYALIPYSMSGLEAIYWTQKNPNEVKAITGLYLGIPDVTEKSDIIGYKGREFLDKIHNYQAYK